MIFRTVARNFAAHEENPIHDPDRVRAVGWRQAAIPGAAVFGYLCQPLIETLGERWFSGFATDIRFTAPMHDGNDLEIRVVEDGATFRIDCQTRGLSVATMRAEPLGKPPTALPGGERAPRDRPVIDWQKLRPGLTLTAWHWLPGVIENAEATAQVDDQSHWYREGYVHPHAILNVANRTLTNTFQMPHWLHVESSIATFRPIKEDESIEVSGEIVDAWARGQHQFVDIAVRLTRVSEVVVAMTHRSIVNFGATPTN